MCQVRIETAGDECSCCVFSSAATKKSGHELVRQIFMKTIGFTSSCMTSPARTSFLTPKRHKRRRLYQCIWVCLCLDRRTEQAEQASFLVT